jgi:hypothetical protein
MRDDLHSSRRTADHFRIAGGGVELDFPADHRSSSAGTVQYGDVCQLIRLKLEDEDSLANCEFRG